MRPKRVGRLVVGDESNQRSRGANEHRVQYQGIIQGYEFEPQDKIQEAVKTKVVPAFVRVDHLVGECFARKQIGVRLWKHILQEQHRCEKQALVQRRLPMNPLALAAILPLFANQNTLRDQQRIGE